RWIRDSSTLVEQPQSYEVPPERGIRLRIDLSRFGLLDFGSAEEIYRIGYEHAMTMMDSIRSRVSARTSAEATGEKRREFKALTPPLRFGHVRVDGASEQQNSYIASFFRPDKGTDTIGIDRARRAFYRVVSSDRLKSLIPQASLPTPQSDLFTLDLSATVKSRYSAAVGGYITSSNNSYLYLSGEYSSLSYRSASAKAAAWIGQSYMAGEVSAELFLPSATPSSLSVRAVASRTRYSENEKYFFRDSEPTFLIAHEYYGKAEWSCALGRTGVFQAGAGGAHLFNSFYRNNDPESYRSGRDHESLDLGMVYAGVEFSTIDRINFPLAGHYWRGRVAMAGGRSRFESGTADAADVSHHRL
ncbi:MAG: hypothetical protein K2F63_02795, partial [Muribaculaceae bacterium]|nr:hypothetical protein [Muribaculaceae bacterium]